MDYMCNGLNIYNIIINEKMAYQILKKLCNRSSLIIGLSFHVIYLFVYMVWMKVVYHLIPIKKKEQLCETSNSSRGQISEMICIQLRTKETIHGGIKQRRIDIQISKEKATIFVSIGSRWPLTKDLLIWMNYFNIIFIILLILNGNYNNNTLIIIIITTFNTTIKNKKKETVYCFLFSFSFGTFIFSFF